MMDQRLRNLLHKLAQPESSLDHAELEYLRTLVGEGPRPSVGAAQRRPLWDFIRRSFPVTVYASRPNHVYPRVQLESLVRAMDASIRPGLSVLGLLATRTTRDQLVRTVAEHVAHEDEDLRVLAIRIAGHCALTECGDAIAQQLANEDGTEGRMVRCEALGRMGFAGTAEAVAPFLDSQADDLWFDARAAMLLAGGQVTPQFLRELLERGTATQSLVVRFRDALVPLAAQAHLERGAFAKVLEESGYGTRVCESVAAMALATENLEIVEDLLGAKDDDLRTAIGLATAAARASWATPALRKALKGESHGPARRSLVAALAWVGPEPDEFLHKCLESSDVDDRVGAVWAALGRPEFNDAVAGLANVESDDLRIAVGCTLSVNGEGGTDDDVRREYYWSRLKATKWWGHTIPRRLARAASVTVPPTFAWFDSLAEPWAIEDLERAAEFVREHPTAAFAKLSRLTAGLSSRRLIACHGLANTATSRGHLEHRLLVSTDADELAHVYLELECCGGPQTVPGRMIAKSLATDEAMELEAHELAAATVIARAGAADARLSIIAALPKLGAEVEPHLLALLIDAQPKIADEAAAAVAQLDQPSDPYLQRVKEVLAGQSQKLEPGVVARMLSSCSPALRTALVRALDPETQSRSLWVLVADRDRAVANAARAALGERPEPRPIFLLRLHSDSKASAAVESRVADHARHSAVVLAPGGYDLQPLYDWTADHKPEDLPSEIEHGLCDAGKAFISEHRKAFAQIFDVEGGRLSFQVGFTNVPVEILEEGIAAIGDDAIDADRLLASR